MDSFLCRTKYKTWEYPSRVGRSGNRDARRHREGQLQGIAWGATWLDQQVMIYLTGSWCAFFLSFLLSHVSSFHFSHLMILLLVNLHYSPFWYVLLTDMWVGLVRPALHFQPDMLTNVHFIGIFHPTVISNLLTPDSSQSCLQSITKWRVSQWVL